MLTGLVSVTFRQLPVPEIILLAAKAGLSGIEWGADVHVPDPAAARNTRRQMESAGLRTLSLGSYYRAGESQDFSPILNTAVSLGALSIRVWAGTKNSEDAPSAYRQAVADDLRHICTLAAREGIDIALEYHGNTLTNRADSCLRLLAETGAANLYTYWQPLEPDPTKNSENLKLLCNSHLLKNLHVYHWVGDKRLPLAEAAEDWAAYLKLAAGYAPAALLEFVRDDAPGQFLADAETLHRLLQEVNHAV